MGEKTTKRRCKAKTKAGKPCKAAPQKDGDYCLAHTRNDEVSRGFGGPQPGSGRPRNPRPTEVMRRLVEQHVEVVLAPHFRTLGYKLERDEAGELTIVPDPEGGAKIYGESKEGDINMTAYDDLGAHIAAAEKLLDRIYGRPRQTTEISGPGGGKIDLDISGTEIEDARSAFLAAFGNVPAAAALHKPSEN